MKKKTEVKGQWKLGLSRFCIQIYQGKLKRETPETTTYLLLGEGLREWLPIL